MEEKVSESEAVASGLRAQRDRVTVEATGLKEEVARLSNVEKEFHDLQDVESKLGEAEQNNSLLSKKLNMAIDEKEENIAVLQSVIDARIEENRKLTEELKVALERHDVLVQRCESAEKTIEDKENMISDKTLQLESSERELIGVEERLKDATDKNTEMQKLFDDRGAEIRTYQEEVERLRTELDEKATEIEALKGHVSQITTNMDHLATKLTGVTVAHELAEIETKVLQAEIDASKAQCAELSKSLASSHDDAELKAKEWRVVTETQVHAMRGLQSKLDSSEIKCLSLEKAVVELKVELEESVKASKNLTREGDLRAGVKNVVDSIICNASYSATVKSLSLQLDETKRQLDITRLSLSQQKHRSDLLAQKLSSLQSVELDHDIGNNKTTETMHQAYHEQQNRIKELEDALRDAARTVAATNKELIAAQALLVEISSDKTAMRAELSYSEQRIQELENHLHSKCLSRSTASADRQNDDISEVSEPEPNALDAVPDEDDECSHDIVETNLKTAHVHVVNLKTALYRSVKEADCASSLLTEIVEKIGTLERIMRSSQENELALNRQLSEMKHLSETEKAELLHQINSGRQVYEKLIRKHYSTLENVRTLNATISDLEEKVVDLRQERQSLSSRVDDLQGKIERFKGRHGRTRNPIETITIRKGRVRSPIQ